MWQHKADRPLPGPWLPPPRAALPGLALATRPLAALAGLLAGLLERERGRWILWAPVLLGAGIASFFALPAEPPAWLGALAAVLAAALILVALRSRRRPLREALLLALALLAGGMALAEARLLLVAAPILARTGTYRVEGRIIDLAPAPEGAKALLDQLVIQHVAAERTPATLRVNLRDAGDLAPGDRIRVLARLQPPMPPALPDGFDFARQAYLDGLGAVGFAFGRPERLAGAENALSLLLARLRASVANRILSLRPDDGGAMAAALIAGVRAGIDQPTWRAMQASGLAHLISVSGLHMVLVAGSMFTACRWLLALIPWLALRYPVRRIAAVAALLAAAFYLGLSGSSVPTQRSFLTTAVGLIAIMVDRSPLSMRLLAWSALTVLLFSPESVLGASFQLSFAAVLGLVAFYESWRPRAEEDEAGQRPRSRPKPLLWRYLLGICATTLVASTVTTPLAAFHFQTIPTYGVLANLIAVPLTSFIVMPAGMLGLLLLSLGWDAPAFIVMVWGVDGVLWTARTVAGLPGALLTVQQWPFSAMVLLMAGGLWLALWRLPWRWLGLLPMALALLLVLLTRPPDLLIGTGLGMAAVRHADGGVSLIEWQKDRLTRESWLRALANAPVLPAPKPGAPARDGIACDAEGCVIELGTRRVALAYRAGAAREDCALADLVVARIGPERCPGAALTVGPRTLAASGGLALRLEADGLALTTVQERRGDWPWSRR